MKKVTEKWRAHGWLDGLPEEQQDILARGLENQAVWCLTYGGDKADFLLLLTKAVIVKVLDHLVSVTLPVFIDEQGNAATVSTAQYGLRVANEEMSNISPDSIEKLAAVMAAKLLDDKGEASKIYLYTPIILWPSRGFDLSAMTAYRAAFR